MHATRFPRAWGLLFLVRWAKACISEKNRSKICSSSRLGTANSRSSIACRSHLLMSLEAQPETNTLLLSLGKVLYEGVNFRLQASGHLPLNSPTA